MNELTDLQKLDLLKLADHMESEVPEEKLYMNDWVRSCGTVGCLVFHAAQVFPDRLQLQHVVGIGYKIINLQTRTVFNSAFEDAFGPKTGELCFPGYLYGEGDDVDLNHLTPKEVADGIRKFVERN